MPTQIDLGQVRVAANELDYDDLNNKPLIYQEGMQTLISSNGTDVSPLMEWLNNNYQIPETTGGFTFNQPFYLLIQESNESFYIRKVASWNRVDENTIYIANNIGNTDYDSSFTEIPYPSNNGSLTWQITTTNNIIVNANSQTVTAAIVKPATVYVVRNGVDKYLLWDKLDHPTLANVATSGDYNDLINKPQQSNSNTFIAIYGTTLYEEITNAINTNKTIYIKDGDVNFIASYMEMESSNLIVFYPITIEMGYLYTIRSNNQWSKQEMVNAYVAPSVDDVNALQWGRGEKILLSSRLGTGAIKVSDLTVTDITNKQDNLISGTNIKTINNQSILGSGNIDIQGGTIAQATDSTLGTVKIDSAKNITLDNDGKLVIGGRLGQLQGTTGIYAAADRDPRAVGDSSFLITDAMGMSLDTNRAFALVSGYGVACKSAAAGSTQYRIKNTYANRLKCKMCEGGYASINEATSKVERIIPIVSVTINGNPYTPDSSADSSATADDIIITTEETLNPDSAITNVRLFGMMKSYSTVHVGNGVTSLGGGRNLLIGGGITKVGSSNDNCAVGMDIYVSGNGNAAFGRWHIMAKNRGFAAGTGHDFTNAMGEGAAAVGQYSDLSSTTLLAVGNGTSHTARSNAFEVTSDGSIVLKSPNGTQYKISVDDSGNISTTAV